MRMPRIAKAAPSDTEKTEACVFAVLAVVLSKDTVASDVSALLRERLGLGWTLMTAQQWLTGKRAWQCVASVPDDGEFGGVPKAAALEAVGVAARVCREFDASGGSELAIERIRRVTER